MPKQTDSRPVRDGASVSAFPPPALRTVFPATRAQLMLQSGMHVRELQGQGLGHSPLRLSCCLLPACMRQRTHVGRPQRHDLPASHRRSYPWSRNLDHAGAHLPGPGPGRPSAFSGTCSPFVSVFVSARRVSGLQASASASNRNFNTEELPCAFLPAGPGPQRHRSQARRCQTWGPHSQLRYRSRARPLRALPRPLEVFPAWSAIRARRMDFGIWGKMWTSVAATPLARARISFRPHLRVLVGGRGSAYKRAQSNQQIRNSRRCVQSAEGRSANLRDWRGFPHPTTDHGEQISNQVSQASGVHSSAVLGQLATYSGA